MTSMTAEERAVADWVVKNNKRAGATTSTPVASAKPLSGSSWYSRRHGRGRDSFQVLSNVRNV